MRYLMLEVTEQEALLERLAAMPQFLADRFAGLSPEAEREPGADASFSPVEHCWHLADLERQGFASRIHRLREEVMPHLPDFDGARIAMEREYRKRSLREGIEAFRTAREASVQTIRAIGPGEWERSGRQEGVGEVMLCDLPHMMAEHDDAHRTEIEQWLGHHRLAGT